MFYEQNNLNDMKVDFPFDSNRRYWTSILRLFQNQFRNQIKLLIRTARAFEGLFSSKLMNELLAIF